MKCSYCNGDAMRVTGREIYPHRADLYAKQFFRCLPCLAWVGCHPDGRPMGRLADAELRLEKQKTHALFDPLWQQAPRMYGGSNGKVKQVARIRAYEWLAARMGIPIDECHVGMFDVALCQRAQELIRELSPTPESIRAWAKSRRAAA